MYTLPRKTTMRLRQPGAHLLGWLGGIVRSPVNTVRVELTDWVESPSSLVVRLRSTHFAWFEFQTGEVTPIYQWSRPFEIEPGLALVVRTGRDGVVYFDRLSDDRDVTIALDVARDAVLEGRDEVGRRIARGALPHAWPLVVALARRERNLAASYR